MRSAGLYQENRFLLGQGVSAAAREPERLRSCLTPQTQTRRGAAPGDVRPAPPALAFPACPTTPARPLPGFSPASAEVAGVGEDMGSL